MGEAWVIAAARSPVAKADPQAGAFRNLRPDDLAAHVISTLLAKTTFKPNQVDDIYLGCVRQQGEQGFNIARQAALMAGMPEVTGSTVNRNCGSSLEALHQAARAIRLGDSSLLIAGGVEHMDRAGWDTRPDLSPAMMRLYSADSFHMGLVAEFLAQTFQISREDQDAFAHRSHQMGAAASGAGHFTGEIVPLMGHDDKGASTLVKADQTIRMESSLQSLAKLKPAFLETGTVTAGNASPLSVGVAALLLASEEKCKESGLTPIARLAASAVVAIEPLRMGLGPVPAIKKVLEKTGLTLDKIEIIEINEAFAAQTLAVLKDLSLPMEKINRWGGAIALGHPLGATGARMATTALHAMVRENARYALLAMCIGGGQGIATLFENANYR